MEEKTLIELGLSQSEAKIYISLLELGFCNVTSIINKSAVSKSSFYPALEKLMEKGLVSSSKVDENNYYEAEHPEKLLMLIKEKEDSLKAVLPQLLLKHSLSDKSDVKIMKGTASLKHALAEYLKKNEKIYTIGTPKEVFTIAESFLKEFHEERVSKGIYMTHLLNGDYKDRMKFLNSLDCTDARYLPDRLSSPVGINICGDLVHIKIWSWQTPLVIRIQDNAVADSFKEYFEMLWPLAKE